MNEMQTTSGKTRSMNLFIKLTRELFLIVIVATAVIAIAPRAEAQLLHLWDFSAGNELQDSAGGLHLNVAIGEGDVGGVMGQASDIIYEPGFNGFGQAYRPSYVDVSQTSTAGVGLTGSGFTSPNQFTIEAIVKADAKTSFSAVNYIFQTRPLSDRGYFIVQDDDGIGRNSVGGIGSIVGNNFGNVGIGAEYEADGTWIYYALVIDLSSTPGQAVADIYSANLSAGEVVPTLRLNERTWNTENPNNLAGATAIFGIGGFAIDREGDFVAEGSSEWFQGAIDYVAVYDGLLSEGELADNLQARIVPEPSSFAFLSVGVIALFAHLALRRRA